MKKFEVGITYVFEQIIEEKHNAINVGSGDVNVLGTPAMVAMMESASIALMKPYFEGNETSVGTHLEVFHTRATPMGEKVKFTATLQKIEDERRLFFHIMAEDKNGQIGYCNLQRMIIDRVRFMSKFE